MGDSDAWDDLPANGEGWDKPSTIDYEELGQMEASRQYKLRCNELIDATYRIQELEAALRKMKPDAEVCFAAERQKRYNDAPMMNPEPWCDEYENSQQFGNDMAMLADYAVNVISVQAKATESDD